MEGMRKNAVFITAVWAAIGVTAAGCGNLPGTARSGPELTGRFVSAGVSQTGTTYYVDPERGDDDNGGTSPVKPWKSLTKVSAAVFNPGDHILLEASGVWNGQMLQPKGNGAPGQPIVIDLYSMRNGTVQYAADTRPIINGNGSAPLGKDPYIISGAVTLYDQEYWEIHHLEVTNSYELADPEGYKKSAPRQLAGILAYAVSQTRQLEHLVIKDNYVHDVQSEYYQDVANAADHAGGAVGQGGLKITGGIIVLGHWLDPDGTVLTAEDERYYRSKAGYNGVLIEGNAVKRVGLEGIRTKCNAGNGSVYHKSFSNVVIRGNYLEDIAGDAIVLSETAHGGRVENNVVKQACNADLGKANYAGLWCWFSDGAVLQYNEVYGIVYGYNDGEAFDIDLNCDRTLYQYNYSHHNAGGFMLIMSGPTNSIVRYNISANDGGGSRGAAADRVGSAAPSGSAVPYEYTRQSIFHYWETSEDEAKVALVYNNTFYTGDGISTALIGEGNTHSRADVRMRFFNNILYKEGTGTLRLWEDYPDDGGAAEERPLYQLPAYFRNNIIYPKEIITRNTAALSQSYPNDAAYHTAIVAELQAAGNIFEDPKLLAADDENRSALENQKHTAYAMTGDIAVFTGTAKLRDRAGLFKPRDGSPAFDRGLDGERLFAADASRFAAEDFFGNPVPGDTFSIGAYHREQ